MTPAWVADLTAWTREFVARLRIPAERALVELALVDLTVRVERNMRSRAGQFRYRRGSDTYGDSYTIRVNAHLPAAAARKTFGHELAHLIDEVVDGPGPSHGPRWLARMVELGLEPRARYDAASDPDYAGIAALRRHRPRAQVTCACGYPYVCAVKYVGRTMPTRRCVRCNASVGGVLRRAEFVDGAWVLA